MIQHFLNYIAIEKGYSPRTVKEYSDDLHFLCRFLGIEADDFDARKVGEEDIRLWMAKMMDEGQSPRSVKRRLSAVKSIYKFLLAEKKVTKDITHTIVPPKADKPLPVYFRESEMEEEKRISSMRYEVEENHPDKQFVELRDYLIIQMLYQTGMRRAELAGLNDEDVDVVLKQVRILGKRRKVRIVPFGDSLSELIQTYKQSRDALVPMVTGSPFLVRQLRGEWCRFDTKNGIYNIVRARMGEVSTLRKHSPHVLRHTFATTMLQHGADIRTIQALLGHAGLATTQMYTHTTFEQIRKEYSAAHPRSKQNNHL